MQLTCLRFSLSRCRSGELAPRRLLAAERCLLPQHRRHLWCAPLPFDDPLERGTKSVDRLRVPISTPCSRCVVVRGENAAGAREGGEVDRLAGKSIFVKEQKESVGDPCGNGTSEASKFSFLSQRRYLGSMQLADVCRFCRVAAAKTAASPPFATADATAFAAAFTTAAPLSQAC
eukprot:6187772-Pleurochrysis_carterae.AAC.1